MFGKQASPSQRSKRKLKKTKKGGAPASQSQSRVQQLVKEGVLEDSFDRLVSVSNFETVAVKMKQVNSEKALCFRILLSGLLFDVECRRKRLEPRSTSIRKWCANKRIDAKWTRLRAKSARR